MTDFVERTWTSADGLTLSARDYTGAAGPARLPVSCIHGLTRNARDFEVVALRIAGLGRRVLAVDVRGRGNSAWAADPAQYAVPIYIADMIALAGAAGIARAVFVGTSMGGLITMGLAAAAPTLVAAAVLNAIGPELAPEGLARIGAVVGEPVEATSGPPGRGAAAGGGARAGPRPVAAVRWAGPRASVAAGARRRLRPAVQRDGRGDAPTRTQDGLRRSGADRPCAHDDRGGCGARPAPLPGGGSLKPAAG